MAQMTATSTDIRAEIRIVDEIFESSFAKGDAAGVAALYAENGVLLPPASEPVTGRQAIQNFWQAVMDMGVKTVKLEIIEIDQLDNTAVERGIAILSGADGQIVDQVKYMVIWKRINNQWKLHRDMWNSNLSPQ